MTLYIATQRSFNLTDQTHFFFVIVGIATYFDSEGTSYRSDYCRMRAPNGELPSCERRNEIH